jgi:hypothetical protein
LLNKINNKKKTSLLSDVSDSISVLILQWMIIIQTKYV